jgi:hypothetical protein
MPVVGSHPFRSGDLPDLCSIPLPYVLCLCGRAPISANIWNRFVFVFFECIYYRGQCHRFFLVPVGPSRLCCDCLSGGWQCAASWACSVTICYQPGTFFRCFRVHQFNPANMSVDVPLAAAAPANTTHTHNIPILPHMSRGLYHCHVVWPWRRILDPNIAPEIVD